MEHPNLDEGIFREAIIDHALCLGIDPVKDAEFLWLAEEALLAPLPDAWQLHQDQEGNNYYYNNETKECTWDNPLDEPYRQIFQKLKNNPTSALLNSSVAKDDRQTRHKSWGQFPGEGMILDRAQIPLAERRKALGKELGFEQKDVDEYSRLSSDESSGSMRSLSSASALPHTRRPAGIAVPSKVDTSPPSPQHINVDNVGAIENHRTMLDQHGNQALQYQVRWSDLSRSPEWINGKQLLTEMPHIVHDYNNRILCTVTNAHNAKMQELKTSKAGLEQAVWQQKQDFDSQLKDLQKKHEEEVRALRDKSTRNFEDLLDEKNRLMAKMEQAQQSKSVEDKTSATKLSKLQDLLHQVESERNDLRAKNEELLDEIQRVEKDSRKEIMQVQEGTQTLAREKERIAGECSVLKTNLELVKREIDKEMEENISSRKQLAEAETIIDQMKRDHRILLEEHQREQGKLRKTNDDLRDRIQFLEDHAKNLETLASSSNQNGEFTQAELDENIKKQVSLAKERLSEMHFKQVTELESTIATFREQIARLEDERAVKSSEQIKAREEVELTLRKCSRLESQMAMLETANSNLKAEIDKEFNQNEAIRREFHELQETCGNMKRQHKTETQALEKRVLEISKINEDLREELKEIQNRPPTRDTELEDQLDILRKESRQKIHALEDDLQAQVTLTNKASAEVAELEKRCKSLREKFEEKDLEVNQVKSKLSEAQEQKESDTRTIERLSSENKMSENRLNTLKEELSRELENSNCLRGEEGILRTDLANMAKELQKWKQGDKSRQGELDVLNGTIRDLQSKLEISETGTLNLIKELEKIRSAVADGSLFEEKAAKYEKRINELEQSFERCKREMDEAFEAQKSKKEIELQQARSSALLEKDSEIKRLKEELAREKEAALSNEAVVKLQREIESYQADAKKHHQVVAEAERLRDQYEYVKQKLSSEAERRRKLHNKIVDLQGNIRVYCRVRPVLQHERNSGQAGVVVDFPCDGEIFLRQSLASREQDDKFEFDQVFQPDAPQELVFKEVEPLAQSALDGYNVCIFAYGQTGSGKTYTMDGTPTDRGVNHRTFQTLFDGIAERQRENQASYKVTMSVLEIYNETIRDLLDGSNGSGSRRPLVGDPKPKKLEVRQGELGLHVPGLTECSIACFADVESLMERGVQNRTVGAHNANEHSSRSHLVVTVNLVAEQRGKDKTVMTRSKLHLIDLAGSERLDKTNASGSMLQEAKNINKSLSALGNVIQALGKSSGQSSSSSTQHVPFRDSKLTFLLQESLSGNSKVLMFVNISPVEWNAAESLCSLTFANRCRKVQLGQAKKGVESTQVSALKRTIEDLQSQLSRSQGKLR